MSTFALAVLRYTASLLVFCLGLVRGGASENTSIAPPAAPGAAVAAHTRSVAPSMPGADAPSAASAPAPSAREPVAISSVSPDVPAPAEPVPVAQRSFDMIPAARAAEPMLPVRIRIAAAGVDAPVVPVGVTDTGNMGVPENGVQVGWYAGGARPGEPGTAVLGGHLNYGGKPGVFASLQNVAPGDLIDMEDAAGARRTFRVRRREQYHVASAPLEAIFRGGEGSALHIITCAGVWREELGHYDERLVLFAELVADSSA